MLGRRVARPPTAVPCEILLVPLVDVVANPQFRHHVKPGVGGPEIDEYPEASREHRAVGGLTAEPVPDIGLPARAVTALRLDLDRNSVGVVTVTREYVDARHVAREGDGIPAPAVNLGGYEQFPRAAYLLVS